MISPASVKKSIAVVGAGPAGLAAAITAAQRGHKVSLFDSSRHIGGQFNLARKIPGKEEFAETLRYYSVQLARLGVDVRLNNAVDNRFLNGSDFDEVIIATGIKPRIPAIEGIDHPMVASYIDVINGTVPAGERVAIIGAGGIGFDVAELLSHSGPAPSLDIPTFMHDWGVDMSLQARGGIEGVAAEPPPSPRELYLCQRKSEGLGKNLGKTTGWIHRLGLVKRGVKMLAGCEYLGINDDGLQLLVDQQPRLLEVDQVIICAGQEPLRELAEGLQKPYHLIGGADVATELDAKRAIDQGTRLAANL